MIINYYKLGLVAAVLAATFYFIHIQREIGADKALENIQKDNRNATQEADNRESDFINCINSGGVHFDFHTGKCSGSEKRYWFIPDWFYGQDHSGSKQN